MSTTYWFSTNNISGIDNKIRGVINSYETLSRNAMEISTVMSNYINVAGKWNDDNSVEVAKWWNKGGANGNLALDKDLGLTIVPSSSGVYDGEDRIRGILNRCSYLFWIVICRPMYSVVTTQYVAAQSKFTPIMNKCYSSGRNILDNGNFVSNNWDNFMSEFATDVSATFKSTTLPVENTNGGSNDAEISNFMREINTKIQCFVDSLKQFVSAITPIMQDTASVCEYFGFSPNTDAEIARNDLIRISKEHITDFQDNLKTAISRYSGDVTDQINQYLSTTYNIQ